VNAALTEIAAKHPELTIELISSTVTYTESSYQLTIKTLLEGAFLTIVIVFFFLKSWRATLVAAVALPLSILPAFFVLALFDYSLNSITLLALTLVIGILVDDAIVEIENIQKYIERGERPYLAALKASDAIGFAIVAITLTIVAVFLPVSFIGGFVGKYFVPFGVTVSAAVFSSLLVARLVTPVYPVTVKETASGISRTALDRKIHRVVICNTETPENRTGAGISISGGFCGFRDPAACRLYAGGRYQCDTD
ncbi:MAG: efflux RND transporter permease subunit, partial [Morganella morganii]